MTTLLDEAPLYVANRLDHVWLKYELEKPGRSQSALARYLGLAHPSIVNRMVGGQRKIKATEADLIRAYLDATINETATITTAGQTLSSVSILKVRGVVQAGSWKDLSFADVHSEEVVAPKSVADTGAYALKVVGPSMNLYYGDGGFVIVRPWYGGEIAPGKHVIVEREKSDGCIETTIKELRRGGDGRMELWPQSNHPAHQTPIPYEPTDDIQVRVIGIVTWGLSPAP